MTQNITASITTRRNGEGISAVMKSSRSFRGANCAPASWKVEHEGVVLPRETGTKSDVNRTLWYK